ncbi:MAG TPA: PAS domain S-box protein [Polyangiaceae bacterium]|nr:PAS domain S-box protein [Polyangiaceae bacterium]
MRATTSKASSGREVSCALLTTLIGALDARGIELAELVTATSLSPARLRSPGQRIGWHDFCVFLRNAAAHLSEDDLRRLGERFVQLEPTLRFHRALALVVGTSELYFRLGSARARPIQRLLSCLDCRVWDVGPNRLMCELRVADGHPVCPELYLPLAGALGALPRLLRQPDAVVSLEVVERGAFFHVQLSGAEGVVSRSRRAYKHVRALRVAVTELQAAHEMLNRQYGELRRAQQALRESEERFRALIENSTDFILLANAAGIVTYLSPSAERIIGATARDLIGRHHTELIHPAEREQQAQLIDAVVRGERQMATPSFRIEASDGRTIVLEGTAKNMLADRRVRALVINYRDVTLRVRLEEELLESRKLESIGRLAGGIAHDFNNILTGILAHAQLALMGADESSRVRPKIEEIITQARRAANLTSQLLSFARKQIMKPKPINLNDFVLDSLHLLEPLLGDAIEIVTELEPELGTVEVDPSRFQQVLVNLAINARDAMPNGGNLTIVTRNLPLDRWEAEAAWRDAAETAGDVMLAVSDTGVGMDDSTLARLFEPFFTTKGGGRGTGLGLATCQGIVKQAGGRIEVVSGPGGTTFQVYLKRVNRRAVKEPPALVSSPAPRGDEVLLLVEDEAAVRTSTTEWLSRLGYTVLAAADGQSALDVVRHHAGPIHAVIADVVLPKLNGPALVRELRGIRPDLAVIYISGYPRQGIPPGEILISKPFELADLATKLREVLASTARASPALP